MSQTTYPTLQNHQAQVPSEHTAIQPYRADTPPPHLTTDLTGRKCTSQTCLQRLAQPFTNIQIYFVILDCFSSPDQLLTRQFM